MNYKFPVINNLEDVLPAIDGRDEFIISKKDGYTVINYAVVFEDTFPEVETNEDAIRRECRGIIFDENGNILARRFHKFFNVNEKDETAFDKIDLSKPHHILLKLDGSMLTPFFIGSSLRWGTKMGITDVSIQAETFIANNPKYKDFAIEMLDNGYTPIFEWCSLKQKIVIDYAEDKVILTALRNNTTGEYVAYEKLKELCEEYDLELVEAFEGTLTSMQDLIDHTRNLENEEGYVIRFDDGHMLKIKSDWYVLRHKSKDSIMYEKNVLSYIFNDQLDDVLPYLMEEDKTKLIEFKDDIFKELEFIATKYETDFSRLTCDKRTWAIDFMSIVKVQDPFAPTVIFGLYSGVSAKETLFNYIKKNLSTQTKVDSIRFLWNNKKWIY